MTLRERFAAKFRKAPSGCWEWTASLGSRGYGQIHAGAGRPLEAHRVAWELFVGPIPDGLEIDHLCRNKRCVNPGHLEPVTHRENMLRGKRGRMVTECAQGHPYTPENTLRRRNGRRACRECNRLRNRTYRERLADAA